MCVLIVLLWLKNVVGVGGLLDDAKCSSSKGCPSSKRSAIGKVTSISPA